jgi:hypothetical protein
MSPHGFDHRLALGLGRVKANCISTGGKLCGPRPQGPEAGRPASPVGHEDRSGHQSQDRKSARPHNPAEPARDRICIAYHGERDPAYDEAQVSAVMKKPEISLKVTLGLGHVRNRCSATISDRDIRKTKNPERIPIRPNPNALWYRLTYLSRSLILSSPAFAHASYKPASLATRAVSRERRIFYCCVRGAPRRVGSAPQNLSNAQSTQLPKIAPALARADHQG